MLAYTPDKARLMLLMDACVRINFRPEGWHFSDMRFCRCWRRWILLTCSAACMYRESFLSNKGDIGALIEYSVDNLLCRNMILLSSLFYIHEEGIRLIASAFCTMRKNHRNCSRSFQALDIDIWKLKTSIYVIVNPVINAWHL